MPETNLLRSSRNPAHTTFSKCTSILARGISRDADQDIGHQFAHDEDHDRQ